MPGLRAAVAATMWSIVLASGSMSMQAVRAETVAAFTADGGRYYGPIVYGRRDGVGRVEWDNGARYEGEFHNGLFHGRGKLTSASRDVYEGQFVDGVQNGRGRLRMADGATYTGAFRHGAFDGPGRYDDGRGNLYEGQFKAGQYHGRGRSTGPTGVYEGDYVRGQPHGSGELTHRQGRRYRGGFAQGLFEGKGRLEEADGTVYEGEFLGGEFSGQGKTSWPGGAQHEGRFKNWRPDGPGIFHDGHGNTYEGQFTDGVLVGPARLAASDGSRYSGEVRSWVPHGHGELRRANGDVYTGGFAFGQFDGDGVLAYAQPQSDGRTEDRGLWAHGRLKQAEEAERHRARADIETALDRQSALLAEAIGGLAPRDPNAINMYVLAIAGDGSQEVFRREVEFVRRQFDENFDTRGHSLVLVNSRSTVGRAPLATRTSIRRALEAIGARMDKDRDVLFLYVTSHGSREHELALGLSRMDLPGLDPTELKAALAASGARWRVVVLSACYAGGFIDTLRDPHTLVIASARHDRRSFGCADENEFTHFGRAFFKESLPTSNSFGAAFDQARRLVREWEDRDTATATPTTTVTTVGSHAETRADRTADARDLHSEPQIEVGALAGEHLQRWWAQVTAQTKAPRRTALQTPPAQ